MLQNRSLPHVGDFRLGMWSAPSIKAKLKEMAAAGLIEPKRVVRGAHDTNLYFRSRA